MDQGCKEAKMSGLQLLKGEDVYPTRRTSIILCSRNIRFSSSLRVN